MSIAIVSDIPVYIGEQLLANGSLSATIEATLPMEPLVVTTEHLWNAVLASSDIDGYETYTIERPSLSVVDELVCILKEKPSSPPLIAVGGGKVIDVTKSAARRSDVPWMAIPTSLSHDGICSPVAVLDEGDRKVRTACKIPVGVAIDLSIVQRAPQVTTLAGCGDLLSNISANKDWELAQKRGEEYIIGKAYDMSQEGVTCLLSSPSFALDTPELLHHLASGLIISGLSMAVAGNSRPASGGEHLFSHALDSLYPEKRSLHGLQVALGTILMESLRGELNHDLVNIFKKLGLPVRISELGFTLNEVIDALKIAPNMNPGRYTILSEVSLEYVFLARHLERFE